MSGSQEKTSVTLSINQCTWKDFQVYCINERVKPSHLIELFMKKQLEKAFEETAYSARKGSKVSAEREAKTLEKLLAKTKSISTWVAVSPFIGPALAVASWICDC